MIFKPALWEPFTVDLPWLTAIGRDWDLVTMPAAEWETAKVTEVVMQAIATLISVRGRGVAQATKLLHLKRPALVPVIDSFVASAIGARLSADGSVDTRAAQSRAIIDHFRSIGGELRPQLEQVDAHLRVSGIERTLARILDALIWCSQADVWTALTEVLGRWR
jgi:hypothetical protein